jgi:hypothetical protein
MLATPLGEEMDRDGDDENTSHVGFRMVCDKSHPPLIATLRCCSEVACGKYAATRMGS